jgi:NADPH:quinone reductase-like Zn-dependent oxidoreductase
MASHLRGRTPEQKAAIARELERHIWPLLPQRDPIRPVIDSVYPFKRAADAHARMESSAHIGKIVLTWNAAPSGRSPETSTSVPSP